MKKPMFKMLLFVGILFGLIFGYSAFKSIMMKKHMSSNRMPAVTVSAMKVTKQLWQPQIKAVGSVRAVRGVDVTTQLAGMVREICFKPGSDVKYNTELVKLNDSSEVAKLESLKASQALAKITYERDKAQFEINAVSKQVVDNDYANLASLTAQVSEQQSTVDKKHIKAPFSGRLGISYVNPGQFVNPGDKIVTLQTLDPIYVDFFLPQQYLVQLAKGQTIQLSTNTFPDKLFTGKITTIDPKVDSATRNIQVEATLNNKKFELLPGIFGTVEIMTGKPKNYLTVPKTAITFNPYGEIAFIIKEEGKDKKGDPILIAHQTFVTVGESRGDQITVLKGIKEGDLIVTSGQMKLKNGSNVIINNAIQVSNNPHPKVIDE